MGDRLKYRKKLEHQGKVNDNSSVNGLYICMQLLKIEIENLLKLG